VLDWFDSATPDRLQLDLSGAVGTWHLLAVFNWSEQEREIRIDAGDFYLDPDGRYIAREFWSGEIRRFGRGEPASCPIPPHGCIVLAVRDLRRGSTIYLGSSLHLSQGLEAAWKPSSGRVEVALKANGLVEGVVDLLLPEEPASGSVKSLGDGVFRFPVGFENTGVLEISF
jgi:alpha-galactosidase